MSAGVSIREFARREGCDDKVVRRAISAGNLKTLADGSLDPSLVGSLWRKRNRAADSADSADSADTDPLDEGGVELLASGEASVAQADRIKANALALKHLLAARRAAGDLVETALAERILFEGARQVRDAWANWPARAGPLIAADLGIAPDQVVEILNGHVHVQLAELGEPEADFAG
ncbi:MAG TPA: hypothetical protein VGS12_14595 [Caulobacteraceae bacterium]|nr:hypothetical protein [Caulobacteraceae bacterium]